MFEEILPELKGKGSEGAGGGSEGSFSPIAPVPVTACFVDGGNAPVFESATARVEFIRVYGTIHDGKERKSTKRQEGLVLLKRENGKIIATGYRGLVLELEIPEDDESLRFGKEKVSLGTVASLARYVLECRFLADFGKECALLVRDGSLEGNNPYEEKELASLLEHGDVCGLSKTQTLTGKSLIDFGPKEPWLTVSEKKEGISIGFVKLHERSDYFFRLDAQDIEKAVSALTVTAGDAVFPGYPYPLIETDQLARVSNKELEGLQMRFKVEAGEDWKRLERRGHSADAHSVLDSIK